MGSPLCAEPGPERDFLDPKIPFHESDPEAILNSQIAQQFTEQSWNG